MTSLRIRPITIRDAKVFVRQHHRHHIPPQGAKFAICAMLDGALVGVAIVGKPGARKTEEKKRDGVYIAEITRVCALPDLRHENGHSAGVCSKLYSRAKRICDLMGYDKTLTFICGDEPGSSLRAAGWTADGCTPGRSWSVPSRPRTDKHPLGPRQRYVSLAVGMRWRTAASFTTSKPHSFTNPIHWKRETTADMAKVKSNNDLFPGMEIDKPPLAVSLIFAAEGYPLYTCPHCGKVVALWECDVIGSEDNCVFCAVCNCEFET